MTILTLATCFPYYLLISIKMLQCKVIHRVYRNMIMLNNCVCASYWGAQGRDSPLPPEIYMRKLDLIIH